MTCVCFVDELNESVAECPCCGIIYGSGDDLNLLWICCDGCDNWYDWPSHAYVGEV